MNKKIKGLHISISQNKLLSNCIFLLISLIILSESIYSLKVAPISESKNWTIALLLLSSLFALDSAYDIIKFLSRRKKV